MEVERNKLIEEIMLMLSLTGLCKIRLQSYLPYIETYISKTEMWAWRIDIGYPEACVQLELEGSMREAREGLQRDWAHIPKASSCWVKEFESNPESCDFEEGDICILERDLSGRIMEDKLEQSQICDICSNLSKKWDPALQWQRLEGRNSFKSNVGSWVDMKW